MMPRCRYLALLLTQCALLAVEPAAVQVMGDVRQPLALTAEDLARMSRASVRRGAGAGTAYEGVWLHEVLQRAGVPQGPALRGKALSACVLAEGEDGYRVVFSLGELDPGLVENPVLLADTANGKPLAGQQGRFRLVLPKDKRAARSVRMLKKLEVIELRK